MFFFSSQEWTSVEVLRIKLETNLCSSYFLPSVFLSREEIKSLLAIFFQYPGKSPKYQVFLSHTLFRGNIETFWKNAT